jgi:hypothetical protein
MSRARLLAAAFGADGTLNTSDVAGLSTVAVSGQYTDLLSKPVLSTVATSGLFADLLSKPTTLSGYGISDALASATAASTYQTILVSGTSIKTVNGNSVLGSGNIQIDGGVTSFNTRTGTVTLSSADVTGALGFTPYNSSNPSGYITSSSLSSYLPLSGGTLTGELVISTGGSSQIRVNSPTGSQSLWTRVGYDTNGTQTLVSASTNVLFQSSGTSSGTFSFACGNDKILSITLAAVNALTALQQSGNQVLHAGNYTSYSPSLTGTGASGTWGINVTGNAATVSSITSGQVTTALGYTPYNSSNPSGYVTSASLSNYLTLAGGTLTGNLVLGTGSDKFLQIGSSSNYFYRLQSTGDHFQIIEGNNVAVRLAVMYPSGNVMIGTTTDSGHKLNVAGTMNSTGAMTQAGNQVLHAGNYTTYTPSKTGSGASGTWGISITGRGYPLRSDGTNINFIWSGQSGQPTWLWGGSDGTNMYVYNPSNFSVNYATSAGSAGSVSGGLTTSNYSSYSTFSGAVTSGGNNGFYNNTYYTNSRNPIWGFANATTYGLAYYQAGAGISGYDAIGFSPNGASSASGSSFVVVANGNAIALGTVTSSSDERLKKDWAKLPEDFVERLAQVKNGTYSRTDLDARQVGVSAQSLQSLMPEAVIDGEYLSVAYGNAAMAAVVELAKEVVMLRREIEALKSRPN